MKNLIFFITCIFLGLTSAAQTNIRLILKTDLKIDSIKVFDVSSKESYTGRYKDTVDIKFKKQNIDLYDIRCFERGKIYHKQAWLDPGNITVKARTDNSNLIVDTVINSPSYYGARNYYKTLSNFNAAKDTIARNNFALNEIKKNIENPRSIFIAFEYIFFNQNSNHELLKLKKQLAEQRTDLSWFLVYPMVKERLDKLLEIKTIHFSDFTFSNRQNKITAIDLNKYDYVVLDFWFVGCASCAQQHKTIKQDYQKLNNKKIGVIGISSDENFKVWTAYLSQHSYNWDNYLQVGKSKLSDYLGINAFPAYVVISKKGEIIGNYDSWDSVVNILNK